MAKIHQKLLFLSVTALFWAVVVTSTMAQKSGDLTLDPIFQEVVVDVNDVSRQFQINLTNNTDASRTFRLKIVDFGSLNETGGVAFIGLNKIDSTYKYGLAAWLKLEKDILTIAAGRTERINVSLINDESLSPGGHYGAVLVSQDRETVGQEEPNIELSQVVSSLILAKKIGGETYKLQLDSISSQKSAFSLLGKVNIRFYNAGNVHLVPRGTVTITDKEKDGKIIKEGLINAESGFILPSTYRQYIASLQNRQTAWWPGSYYQHVSFRYDGNDRFVTKTDKIFYIGQAPKLAIIGLVAIAVVLVLVRKFKLTRYWPSIFYKKRANKR